MKKSVVLSFFFLVLLSAAVAALAQVNFLRKKPAKMPTVSSQTGHNLFCDKKEYDIKSKRLGTLLDTYYINGWSVQVQRDFGDVVEQLKETLTELESHCAPKKLTKRTSSQILCLEKIMRKECQYNI